MRIFICIAFSVCLLFSCHNDHLVEPEPVANGRQVANLNILYGRDKNATVTVYITIYVNGHPLNVVFDTGSTGLRLVNGALSGKGVVAGSELVHYDYGNGTSADHLGIKGVAATMNFSIRPDMRTTPIKFMFIQNAEHGTGNYYSTAGQDTLGGAFRYMNGLMGVGLRQEYNDSISSPLAQLAGSGRFLISLPVYGGSTGQLIINPNAADVSGFVALPELPKNTYALPNGFSSRADDALPGTISIAGVPYAQPTLLDTGNPLIWVYNDRDVSGLQYVPANTAVSVGMNAPGIPSASFKVPGLYSGNGLIETNNVPGKEQDHNSFGVQFFFLYDVLYDPQKGIISVRKKQ